MSKVDKGGVDFGVTMKRAREQRGVSLRQIADVTKLSVRALEALERNDISRLPGGIFSRAFVRAYAVEVGLDPEQTVADFITRFPDDIVTQGHPRTRVIVDERDDDQQRSRLTLLARVAILVALVVELDLGAFAHSEPALLEARLLGRQERLRDVEGIEVDVEKFSRYALAIANQAAEGRPPELQGVVPLDTFLMGFALGVAYEREPDVA